MKRHLYFLLASLAVLAGCGGGGGGTITPTNATPHVTVAWPARTRDLSAPSSALSVRMTLHRTDAAGQDLVFTGDRNGTLTAHNETYAAPTVVPTAGSYAFNATFFANPGVTGTVVGTAAANVKISTAGTLTNNQGQPLGTLAFNGVVRSAAVVAGQFVRVDEQTTLTAGAFDVNANPLVVTPGSFTFALVSGAANLAVAANGNANGIAVGRATVTASIDGVTSRPATVSTVPINPNIVKIQLATADVIYDAQRDLIYASTLSSDPNHPSAVVTVDPATGTVGTVYAPNNQPTWMALSGDGSHLYVGGSNGTVKRLAIPAGTVESTINLPAGTVPAHMLTVPNTTDTWIVALQNGDGSVASARIYDGATARAQTAPLGHIMAINDTGTRVYGYERFLNAGAHYYSADIAAGGLANATANVTAIQGFGNRISWANGHILDDSGVIYEPETVQSTGHLDLTTVDHITGTVRGSDRVYYAAWDPKQILVYDLTSPNLLFSIALGSGVSGGLETLTPCGPKRIVVRSFQGSPNSIVIVSGLP